ncbi:MAG: helix-turn-helix domain-containing protein [Bryobacteraceae bacterium]
MGTIGEQVNPAAQWKHELVARVGASGVFERSPRLRELLTYLCEQAIQNRLEDLKEQAIGRRVFGRAPDYSPGEDNIVRVEVRHLRKRLEEYFAGQGKGEPVVIVIHRGGYVPEFEPREVPPSLAPAEPEPGPAPGRRWGIPAGRPAVWLAAFLAVGLAAAGVWWWSAGGQFADRSAQAVSRNGQRGPIWQMLFDGQQAATIVCADSTLVMAQSITHQPISLEDYVQRDYGRGAPKLTPDQRSLLHTLQGWQFTDVTDVRLVQRMSRLNTEFWGRVLVRSARTVQLQDFKNGNLVLLGSSHSNPWILLFEPQLNFRFGFDFEPQKHSAYILNTAPQAGEQAVYRAASPGESGEVYSTIALVPNLRHSGHVLIIAGSTAEGTETAGEFLMNREASGGLVRELLSRNKGRMPYFEVLLESGAFAGVAQSARVVAMRILPGN